MKSNVPEYWGVHHEDIFIVYTCIIYTMSINHDNKKCGDRITITETLQKDCSSLMVGFFDCLFFCLKSPQTTLVE